MNNKGTSDRAIDHRVTLVTHSVTRIFTKYGEKRLSLHSLINRLILLVQRQIVFCILDDEGTIVFHTATGEGDVSSLTESASKLWDGKSRKWLKGIRTTGGWFYVLPMVVVGKPKDFVPIYEKRGESYNASRRLIESFLAFLVEPDEEPYGVFVNCFITERIAADEIAKAVAGVKVLNSDEVRQDYKAWFESGFLVEDKCGGKNKSDSLIKQYVGRRIINMAYGNVKSSPILKETLIYQDGNLKRAKNPFPNIVFIAKSATTSRAINNKAVPYGLRVILADEQRQDIANHYKGLVKKNTCRFLSEEGKCTVLETQCLLVNYIDDALPSFDERVQSLLDKVETPFGEEGLGVFDDVAGSGFVRFVDRLSPKKDTLMPVVRDTVDFRRHQALMCLLHQLSVDETPGLMVSPVRVSNTTFLLSLVVVPRASDDDEGNSTSDYKERYRQLRWYRNYYIFDSVLSRNINRRVKEHSRDAYLDYMQGVFIKAVTERLEEKGAEDFATQVNNYLMMIARIIPHPLMLLSSSIVDSGTVAELSIHENEHVRLGGKSFGVVYMPRHDRYQKYYLYSAQNRYFMPNAARSHNTLSVIDAIEKLEESVVLKQKGFRFRDE